MPRQHYCLHTAVRVACNSVSDLPYPEFELQTSRGTCVVTRRINVRTLKSCYRCDASVVTRDVEAVEYFLFSLPAPYEVVCFRFQPLSSKCFHKNLTASSFRFHIPAACFMKNASGSSKSQMLPSSLPASFFNVLPLPQNFFHFHVALNLGCNALNLATCSVLTFLFSAIYVFCPISVHLLEK